MRLVKLGAESCLVTRPAVRPRRCPDPRGQRSLIAPTLSRRRLASAAPNTCRSGPLQPTGIVAVRGADELAPGSRTPGPIPRPAPDRLYRALHRTRLNGRMANRSTPRPPNLGPPSLGHPVPQLPVHRFDQFRRRPAGMDPSRTGGAARLDRRPAVPGLLRDQPDGAGRHQREPLGDHRHAASRHSGRAGRGRRAAAGAAGDPAGGGHALLRDPWRVRRPPAQRRAGGGRRRRHRLQSRDRAPACLAQHPPRRDPR